MRTTKSTKPAALGVAWLKKPLALAFTLVLATLAFSTSPALAETHPFVRSFGSFTNPNGIAVDESTGDVYVADIGTNTISKFDASGNPVAFPALHSNALTGAATPAGSFSFPLLYGTPAAIAVDNSTDPSDPSRGDLYVMDDGHGVIDKMSKASGAIRRPLPFASINPCTARWREPVPFLRSTICRIGF